MQNTSIKAIVMRQTGGADVLRFEAWDIPPPGQGEVRVRLVAAGVNYIDIYKRRGEYPVPVPLPGVPGQEGAGIVEILGTGVDGFKVGDRVAYCNVMGSYAEAANVPAEHLIALPDALSFEQGAALPLQGMTAHYLVHDYVDLGPGKTVLIHAAAGGVGLLAVQWARHLGARVVGTVSTEAKARIAREAGADAVVVNGRAASEVMRLTGNRGADLVLDGVGLTTLGDSLNAAADGATVVSYGFPSGLPGSVAPSELIARGLRLAGGNLIPATASRTALLSRARDVMSGVADGWLSLRLEDVLPLADAAEAHRRLENRTTAGKLVLRI